MPKRLLLIVLTLFLLSGILSACSFPMPVSSNNIEETISKADNAGATEESQTLPENTPKPTTAPAAVLALSAEKETEEVESDLEIEETPAISPSPDVSESPTQQAPAVYGPDNFPEGMNPLTGLFVDDPDLLKLPPALISISNFPASARPQAGINTSPIIFEMTIGEGMTRFLAMYYGQFPQAVSGQTEGDAPGGSSDGQSPSDGGAGIGPIRSGRLPYESVRSSYTGFLVMASAYSGVAQTLGQATSIFGSDSDDINSALIGVDKLQQIAESRAEGFPGSNFNLEGMTFSETTPEGGELADTIWVFYSKLNQIQWLYDEEISAYVRYDIKTDDSGEFVMATDRLTGEPVSRENVIVIFAEHDYRAPTLIDIELINKPHMKALLFRDGEIHKIFWTTKFSKYEQETGLLRPIRFEDAAGGSVALKPGFSWIHLVSTASYYAESAVSDSPFLPVIEEAGTGLWLIRYKGKY